MISRSEAYEQISEACRGLVGRDCLAACDGNVSLRDGERIWITGRGLNKGYLKPDQLALVDLQGKTIEGSPSSETKLHVRVYTLCEEAKAVIHAHPPHAIAWSVGRPSDSELPVSCVGEVILATGGIPIAPYQTAGSDDLAHSIDPYLPTHRAIILGRHGAITWGDSLREAYNGMERVEHSAKILYLAATLGSLEPLPDFEIEKLRKMRQEMGPTLL